MRTVLLVEDDPDTRESLADLLLAEGYEVVPCENGEQALIRLAAGLDCHAIILDWRMPRMTGIQFLAHRRNLGAKPAGVPVLVFSADAGVGTDLPDCEVLAKPADAQRVLDAIARLTGWPG